MVGILPTVAKRMNTSFVIGPKVSCASIELYDRTARRNLYLWGKIYLWIFSSPSYRVLNLKMAACLVVPYENYMTWVPVVTFIKGIKSVDWASRKVLKSKDK